jgi:hypothetical protein
MLLIQHGADVYAENMDGESVSQWAYSTDPWVDEDPPSSDGGDHWDTALFRCGYDITNFQIGYPRKTVYTDWCTRKDFEKLWDGVEGACPYYDCWFDTHTYYAPGEDASMCPDEDEPGRVCACSLSADNDIHGEESGDEEQCCRNASIDFDFCVDGGNSQQLWNDEERSRDTDITATSQAHGSIWSSLLAEPPNPWT